MNEYAYIDIILTVLVVLLTFRGFSRGFIREFFALGAPALGVIGGILFYRAGAEFLKEKYFSNIKGLPEILAFIAIFFIIYIVCKALQKLINDVIKGLNLSSLDKLLGGIFGIVEGLAVIALILFCISIQPFFDSGNLLENSLYGKILLPLVTKPVMDGLDILPNTARFTGIINNMG